MEIRVRTVTRHVQKSAPRRVVPQGPQRVVQTVVQHGFLGRPARPVFVAMVGSTHSDSGRATSNCQLGIADTLPPLTVREVAPQSVKWHVNHVKWHCRLCS